MKIFRFFKHPMSVDDSSGELQCIKKPRNVWQRLGVSDLSFSIVSVHLDDIFRL